MVLCGLTDNLIYWMSFFHNISRTNSTTINYMLVRS
jgi:hypothetical protein